MENSKNGVIVTYINSNSVYDIYAVSSIDNDSIIYHEELRNMGTTEEYVLNLYVD